MNSIIAQELPKPDGWPEAAPIKRVAAARICSKCKVELLGGNACIECLKAMVDLAMRGLPVTGAES